MSQYRQAPKYEQPFMQQSSNSSLWYRFFSALDTGYPPTSESAVTLGASPYSYPAPSKGFLLITGGSVSVIKFKRVGTYVTGLTSGIVPVSQNDVIIITYASKPTVIFVPQ